MIEMIGVLAVIAILAAMLVPRVFQAVDSARVNSSVVAIEAVKGAAIAHYGKYGKFDVTNGIPMGITITTYPGYDTNVLLAEGLLDKPFSVRIAGGDPTANSTLQLSASANANGGHGLAGAGYSLDGVVNSTANSQYVLEAVIQNCTAADAKELNDLIDGASLGVTTGDDFKGKVEYSAPSGGVTTVYVYITHR